MPFAVLALVRSHKGTEFHFGHGNLPNLHLLPTTDIFTNGFQIEKRMTKCYEVFAKCQGCYHVVKTHGLI